MISSEQSCALCEDSPDVWRGVHESNELSINQPSLAVTNELDARLQMNLGSESMNTVQNLSQRRCVESYHF